MRLRLLIGLPTLLPLLLAAGSLYAVPVSVAVVSGNEAVVTSAIWDAVIEQVSDISGHDVRLLLHHDHDAVVRGLRSGDIVLAVVDGPHADELQRLGSARVLMEVVRADHLPVRAEVYVRADSIIRSPADLDRHTVALLPPGIHYAATELVGNMLATLAPATSVKVVWADTTDSIVKAVRFGAVDAGAIASLTPGTGPEVTGLRRVAVSPPVPLWFVVARDDYSEAVIQSLADALLQTEGPLEFVKLGERFVWQPPFAAER